MTIPAAWSTPDPLLLEALRERRRAALGSYREDPVLVREQGRQEDSHRTGGYANRQVLELVQNAADAISAGGRRGRVELRLVDGALYCANQGSPFNQKGLEAVTHAYVGDKRDEQMGRFGLGFKSVLGVTTRPTVFSQSVSFGFDAARARSEIAEIVPDADAYPVLRLPYEVDVAQELADDEVLRELAEWAVTIVRLPLEKPSEALDQDLERFPREFMLFAPAVESLGIVRQTEDAGGVEDTVQVEYRCVQEEGPRVTLRENDEDAGEWLVWHRDHRHSQEALEEVGAAIRREQVRLTYAVPVQDPGPLGRFWAYFPLQDDTSTRGIHNAPWRINDDRTSLLDGVFNRELLDVLADMVVAAIPYLSTADDPARHFDYLPARGNEERSFAGRHLSSVIPALARSTACIPNAEGELRRPDDLVFPHSELKLDLESFGLWDKAPGRPVPSPHWTCYKSTTRRARLRSLVRLDQGMAADNEVGGPAWLERIVQDGTDEQVLAALKVVFSIRDDLTRRDMLRAKVLPDRDGSMNRLDATADLYLRGNVLSAVAGLRLLRPSLLELPGAEDMLRRLGFQDVDPSHELRKLSRAAARNWTRHEWEAFWDLVSEVSVKNAQDILAEHAVNGAHLKVKCLDGKWHDVGSVVVPGVVHPADPGLALDADFHELHLPLLASVGVAVRPVTCEALLQDLTLLEYLRLMRQQYLTDYSAKKKPEATSLHFTADSAIGPLHLLRRFKDTGDEESLAVWTAELLQVQASSRWLLAHINAKAHPQKEVLAPHLWAVETYGRLETAWGARLPATCLSPNLSELDPLLPVAKLASSSQVRTIQSIDEIPVNVWREFLSRQPGTADGWALGKMLVEACKRLQHGVPDTLPAVTGSDARDAVLVAPTRLLIAQDEEERRVLQRRALPHVALRDLQEVDLLAERWGCRRASDVLRVEIVSESPGEPVQLLDRFRGLRPLAEGRLDGLELVECPDLARQVTGPDGRDSEATDLARSGDRIFYVSAMSDEDLLARLSEDFGLGLNGSSIDRILADAQDEQVKERIAACRAAATPGEKLLALLPVETLEANLPTGLLDAVRSQGGTQDEHQVVELLLSVHGYNVLNELRHPLAAAGYPVPDKWAASSPAVAFVRRLGFPSEYAGVRGAALDADLTVLGPPRLTSLHRYQRELAEEIRRLVRPSDDPGRALLYLPTGAGKTRVTVEALAHSLMEDGLQGPLLWVAQTEELCEQAVQTWNTIWREFGNGPLRVSRLWGANEVAKSDDALSVVVATDAKLDRVRERDDYEWLSRASAVIVDEAHSLAEGLGRTLEWLGIDGSGKRTSRPLLGLTATPFKGRGEEANRRFARRFGGNLLNVLGEDPYGELQRLGVLARIEHRVLSGSSISLDASEQEQVKTFRTIPQAALERLGRDGARTQRLLDDIASLPEDWPVLVFTASVLNAQVLAALLKVRGIEAASVSGSTRMHDRRRSIEDFREGRIRVLTNCAVLTQGFDAPAVRALYIARPTFSPNAYIQMVGRGLRGPRNGGKPECLVVNVDDTFEQFGDRLAFQEFDYLWEQRDYDEPWDDTQGGDGPEASAVGDDRDPPYGEAKGSQRADAGG